MAPRAMATGSVIFILGSLFRPPGSLGAGGWTKAGRRGGGGAVMISLWAPAPGGWGGCDLVALLLLVGFGSANTIGGGTVLSSRDGPGSPRSRLVVGAVVEAASHCHRTFPAQT
eukprot:609366-Pyramimonas_sp.AAC.1